MRRYLVGRLWQVFPTLLALTIIVFILSRYSGADAVTMRLPDKRQAPEVTARAKHELGLDKPLALQYVDYMGKMARGDWGTSFRYRRPVLEIVADYLPSTMKLALFTVFIEAIFGIVFGATLSRTRKRRKEYLSGIAGAALVSMPSFWLAMLVQYLFWIKLGWLVPVAGEAPGWRAYLLPSLSLAASSIVYIAWISRASIVKVIGSDYIISAKSHGLSGTRLWLRHILPNALAPTIAYLGTDFGALLGGAIATEAVFNLPGLGNLLYKSVLARDRPIVVAVAIILLVGYMAANLLADVIQATLDPRLRDHYKAGEAT